MFDFVLSSPPYAGNGKSDYKIAKSGTRVRDERRGYKQGTGCFRGSETYGDTDGQLGRMRGDEDMGVGYTCQYCGQRADPLNYHEGPDDCRKSVREIPVTVWEGCYDGHWKGQIVDAAYKHPAKFSKNLCQKIFTHMLAKGYIRKGETCVDPFGGVALGGIVAAYHGIRWVGCELEKTFHDLGNENIELHRRKWEALGSPIPVLLNGDSRKLVEIVRRHFDSVVSSPPYANEQIQKNSKSIDRAKQYATYRASGGGASYEAFCATQEKHSGHYGETPGQLGQMAEGIVSSPPFHQELAKVSSRGIGSDKYGGTMRKAIREAWSKLNHEEFAAYLNECRKAVGLSKKAVDVAIGTNTAYSFYEGRMGSKEKWRIPMPSTYLKIKEVLKLDDRFDSVLLDSTIVTYERQAMAMGHTQVDYGHTDGQLGAMPVGDCAISSPPFGAAQTSTEQSQKQKASGYFAASTNGTLTGAYAETPMTTPGQLGMLDAAVDFQLKNTESFDMLHSKGASNDTRAEMAAAIQKPKSQGGILGEMRGEEGGTGISLFQHEHVAGANSGLLQNTPVGNSENDESAGNKTIRQGKEKRKRASSVQGRKIECSLSNSDNQGQVPPLREDGKPGDTSQERRPLRQPTGEPRSLVQQLPHERDEAQVVGGEEGGSSASKEQRPSRVEVNSVLSSPPYEASNQKYEETSGCKQRLAAAGEPKSGCGIMRGKHSMTQGYGNTEGQVGDESGETFWSAARIILQQTHQLLKPGGVAAFVVKDYVRAGKRVPFSRQWLALCESVGFELVEWVQASLVKKNKSQDVFGGEQIEKKERKSFFRRLHESRMAEDDPRRIDHEDVLFVKKVSIMEEQHGDCAD